jgi:hypothetical protein
MGSELVAKPEGAREEEGIGWLPLPKGGRPGIRVALGVGTTVSVEVVPESSPAVEVVWWW